MFGPEERNFFEKPTGAADNYSLARSYGTQPRVQSVGASINYDAPLIPFNIGGGNTTPISNSTTTTTTRQSTRGTTTTTTSTTRTTSNTPPTQSSATVSNYGQPIAATSFTGGPNVGQLSNQNNQTGQLNVGSIPRIQPSSTPGPVFEQDRDIGDAASQTIIQSNPINNIGRAQSSEVVQSGVQTQGQVTGTPTTNIGRFQNSLDNIIQLGGDGGGNQSGGGRGGSSVVQFTIYGPYADACAAYAGKDSKRPVGVFLPQDYGDNFMAPRYFGDRTVTRAFRGGNSWYWDPNGAAILINNDGINSQVKLEPVLVRECEVKPPQPHFVTFTLNYRKGLNHPSAKGTAVSSMSALNGSVPSSVTSPRLTIPRDVRETVTVATITGTVGTQTSSSRYTIQRQSANGKHTFNLLKNGSVVQSNTVNDSVKGGNSSHFAFNVAFDYSTITPPTPYLTVAPNGFAVPPASSVHVFDISSSSGIQVISKPSWITYANERIGRNTFTVSPNATGKSRSGRITIKNLEGITQSINISQGSAIIVPDPTSFTADISFFYKAGRNATKTGKVTASGVPTLSGTFGYRSLDPTAEVVLEKSATKERILLGLIGEDSNGKKAIETYQVRYVYKDGDFEVNLYSNGTRLIESKIYEIGKGNKLVPKNGTKYTAVFNFVQKVDDPPLPNPPELIITSTLKDSRIHIGDIEIDARDGTKVKRLQFVNGTEVTQDKLAALGVKNDYWVKVIPKPGFKFSKWTQLAPGGGILRKLSDLNNWVQLSGDGTAYEWEFDVSRKTEESKDPQVYPTVDTIQYNLLSSDSVMIPYTSNKDTSYVNIKFPDRDFRDNPSNGEFRLRKDYFSKGLGRYIVNFCPYGPQGQRGTEKQVIINVINEEVGYYPDIRDIRYPKKIQGADFVGLDVPFEFSYQSVFTDYVEVYLNDKSTRIGGKFGKVDKVKLNVKDLVKYSGKFKKNKDVYTFTFLLIPYGRNSKESLVGKTEKITIVFDEGDLKLDRNKVIMDICDSLAAQLDYKGFDGYTSKYLTHLLHFGDTNNEVISNWNVDTETFREYEIDPVTKRPTNTKKSDVGFDALVLKMYEPLDTTVQPNQQVWITKIQSEPQLHEVVIRETDNDYCPPLAAPNFSLDTSTGMGYELFDDMLASGTETNAQLVNTFVSQSGIDTKKLDIQYVSGAVTYNSQSLQYESSSQVISWERFSHFGSAEERIKNFWYKVSTIENFNNVSSSLESANNASTSLTIVAEKQRQVRKINEVKAGFDGFEDFLYNSTSSLAYPKNSDGTLLSTGSSDAINWYEVTSYSGSRHDYYNVNYLPNNIPQFVKDDEENADFVLFLDMIGHHFDILWAYTKNINRARKLEHKKINNGVSDELVREMLRSFGYTPKSTMDTAPLWEFALGQYNNQNSARTDGTAKSVMTGKERQSQIWRRILNNLPYIYKSKGTSRGLRAILSTYGISDSIIRVQEFGGPPPQRVSTPNKYTELTETFSLGMDSNSRVTIPWHTGSSYPQTIEFSIQTEEKQDGVIFRNDMFYLELLQDTGSLATFKFHITGSDVTESVQTSTIPFFNDTINSFMIRRTAISGSANETFDIFVKEPFQERVRAQVSASLEIAINESGWNSGSELVFGGFSGSIDNVKLWKTALSESIFDEHVLAPDMYNGNSISSSTEELFVRLDFEEAKNLATSSSFADSGSYRNTAPNVDLYGETFVSMSGFTTSSSYPYGAFNRLVTERTRVVPSTGLAAADKISIKSQTLKSELSPKARATKSGLQENSTDSNRLGLFISPTNNINRDITKALGGTFKIDNFIGDPCAYYDEEYTDLKNFRRSFFSKYTINYDGFYNLIKYIDSTLFDTIQSSIPGRAKATTGLLIEPHLLERNKKQNKRPSGIVFEELVGVEDISKNSVIEISSTSEKIEGFLTASELSPDLSGLHGLYETTMSHEFVDNLSGSYATYNTTMDYEFVTPISGSFVNIDGIVTGSNSATLVSTNIVSNNNNDGSIIFSIPSPLTSSAVGVYLRDSFQTIPSEENGDYYNEGFGITAKNGHAIVTFKTPNGRDKERRKYYLVTENVTDTFPILNNSSDQTSGYTNTSVTTQKKKLTYVSISGSAPSVAGNIVAVEPVDGNLRSHYIYTKDTSTGLENSFFNGCKQSQATTIDGGPAFETFVTNPNTLKVSDSGRGSGEPILEVE